MARTVTALLKTADTALAKDPKKALPALIEAWCLAPSLELRALVTLLEQVAAVMPFEGDTAEWVRAAKKADAWTQSALLQRVRGPTIADTLARFKAATAWGPDPRTARALEEVVVELPWTSDGSKDLWRTIHAAIAAMKDPRFVELASSAPAKWNVRENIEGWLVNGLKKAAGKLTALPLEPDVLAASKALAARLEAVAPKKKPVDRDEAALLADVYAHPDDDAPRLVYADWLLERGDPRGEFITLQFRQEKDPAALKREKALLKEHGRKWLGPLEPVVAAGTFEFRRGFLSKAERRFKTSTEALRESPAWATVEETSASGAELTSPAMRSLKRLVGSDAGDLLAAKTPWRFEAVDCAVGDLDEFRQLLETSLLPRLSVLRIGHAEGRSIDSAKWIAGLTRIVAAELQLRANFHEPVANWILAATPLTGLEVLVLEDDLGTKWRFSRDAQRKLSRLELQVSETRYPKETKERLAAIPGGVLSEFTFTGSNDAEYLELGRARVAAPAQKAEKPATRRLTEKDSFRQIAWGKEGWWVAERDRIALVDPQSGALVRAFQINPADRFQFTNDRVVAGGGSSVRAYSLETGKVEVTLGTGAGGVQDLKVSRDGRFGLVAAEYHAYFFDLQERRVLRKAKAKIYYSGAVSSDGGRFATPLEVRERPSPGVDVIQVMDGKPGSRSVKFGSDVVEPAWLPDGRIICCNRNQHRLLVFDSVTGAQQLVIEGGLEFPTTPVVSPTGKHATCWSDSKLALLDLVTGKVLWQQTPRANQAPVAFSPDGSQVVVGCAIPEVFQVHG